MAMTQKHPATTSSQRHHRFGFWGALLAVALLLPGCAQEQTTRSSSLAYVATSNPQSSQPPITTIATSVLGDPVYDEFGGWWLVTMSSLVVRGTLVGTEGQFRTGDRVKDIWLLDVDEVLLGESDATTLRVATFAVEDIESGRFPYQRPFHPGEEGIFFLVPYFGPFALPEVYAINLGSTGVVTTELDHWSAHIPKAADILGSLALGYPGAPDPLAEALSTETIVEGTITSLGSPLDTLGWTHLEVELSEIDVIWPLPQDHPEGSLRLPSRFIFVLQADHADGLAGSDTIRVRLRGAILPDPVGSVWLAFGDSSAVMDRGIPRQELIDEMSDLTGQRDAYVLSSRETAEQILRRVVAEAGRIPLSSDPVPEPEPVDLDQLYRSPLVIQQDSTLVIFDRWFMTLLDGEAQLTVTNADGAILAKGPVEGPNSIMRELADNSFELVDDEGIVVARVTQQELSAATAAAYDKAANP